MPGRPPTQAFSEFLTNKEQGDWAERTFIKNFNVPRGPALGKPNMDVRGFGLRANLALTAITRHTKMSWAKSGSARTSSCLSATFCVARTAQHRHIPA